MLKIGHIAINRFILILSFTGIAVAVDVQGQNSDTSRVIIQDGWIEDMKNKIAFDISLNNVYEVFEVRTPNNRVVLNPNTANNLRFKFNYDFISVGVGWKPDFLPGNGDEDIRGETKSFVAETSLIFPHWFLDLSYSKVRGYYLENTNEYIPWMEGDPYIQFPDLNYKSFNITTGYIANSKFSLRSIYSQTQRQLKSAGSFIPVFNFHYYEIDDRSGDPQTQKSKNVELNIGPGYGYTFVLKEKFYASLGGSVNAGYLRTDLTTRTLEGDVNTEQDNFTFRWDGKLGIGHNGNRFYSGLYATLTGTEYRQENTTVRNHQERVFYHVFIGMRFLPPRFLKSNVDKVKAVVP